MNRERFIRSRRGDWQQFELLLGRLKSTSDSRWTGHDVSELSRLYRSICYDLSLVQSREWGARLEAYLNDLVAQGHNCLYRSAPASAVRALEFLVYGFPRLLRSRGGELTLATALFVVPLVISIVVALVRPDLAATVVGDEQLQAVVDAYSGDAFARLDGQYGSQRTYMFGYYVSNNTGIAFKAYSSGILAGIGTCLILLSNGITIGMSTGTVLAAGPPVSINYTSFVVTHGAPELTAIVIAGAAGLVLAKGIFVPGGRSRLASLRHHGRESLQLALGAGAMLFVAALLEGYFSALPIRPAFKYSAGALAWLVTGLWLGLSGRERAAS
ncbi:MAG: stage II sporulation protein M [Planctomycetota bacterium]